MALFGAKKSSEFDAELAIRSALLMYAHLNDINQVLQEKDIKLGMRIGINCGLVRTGGIGKERPGDFTVYGDAVNLASRLESNAPEGKILISEDVYRQIKERFYCQDLGTILVKGKKTAVQIYTVVSENNESLERWKRSSLIINIPFIDRVSEMANLKNTFLLPFRSKLDLASLIFAVQGNAGIGKSRLLYEFIQQVVAEYPNIIYFKSRCIPFGSSYYPFTLLIERVLEYLRAEYKENDSRFILEKLGESLQPNNREAYSSCLPYISYLLGISPSESIEEDPIERKLRFSIAINRFFQAFLDYIQTKQCNLLLFFEDVHWLDTASREAMIFFFEQAHSKALLGIFLAFREEYDFRHLLSPALRCSHLHLPPLKQADCQELIESAIGKEVLPAPLVQSILALCQGGCPSHS